MRLAIRAEMEIWIVRHGRTAANIERRFQGRRDTPLNERGRREAAFLGRRLGEVAGFALFLSSDLRRAWETAGIISRAINLFPLREPLLRERSWGCAEGLRREEVAAAYPGLFSSTGGRLNALRCGGEGIRRLLARAVTLRKKIGRRYGSLRRILLVSHGAMINAFISGALGLRSRERWPYAPAPASLSILRCDPPGERYRLLLFDDTTHLDAHIDPLLNLPL